MWLYLFVWGHKLSTLCAPVSFLSHATSMTSVFRGFVPCLALFGPVSHGCFTSWFCWKWESLHEKYSSGLPLLFHCLIVCQPVVHTFLRNNTKTVCRYACSIVRKCALKLECFTSCRLTVLRVTFRLSGPRAPVVRLCDGWTDRRRATHRDVTK